MFKKILLGSLFLISLSAFAQQGSSSPYSYYGIGDVKFKGTIENRSMGGLSFVSDSIHVNFQNPATLASLKMSSLTIAGTQNFTSLKNNTNSESSKTTSLDYITLAIPAGKRWGAYIGLLPYSSVGYKVISSNPATSETLRFIGKGGVNKAFIGAGYKINNNFSFGIEFDYNFGNIENNTALFSSPTLISGTRLLTKTSLSGISTNIGATYKTKIKSLDFSAGITFTPSMDLKYEKTSNIAAVTFDTTGADVISPSNQTDLPSVHATYKLPSKFSIGAGIGENKKWFVGIESIYSSASDFGNIYKSNVSFEAAQKVALGGYYIPKYNSFSSYFYRINYRAGFRYENTGLVLNSESIKDTAFTLGFGLPIPGAISNINIGLEAGSRGTTNAGLIKENYYNISVGLSFNDRWFIKRKYD